MRQCTKETCRIYVAFVSHLAAKDLLEENGKIIGYLTGLSIYNQLGLTTQVSNTLQIGKNQIRPSFKRERTRSL